jgi:hypothetical protein
MPGAHVHTTLSTLHLCPPQNMISPRSRREYDEFNRFHFSKLRQVGRLDKRSVTPKVCECHKTCGLLLPWLPPRLRHLYPHRHTTLPLHTDRWGRIP